MHPLGNCNGSSDGSRSFIITLSTYLLESLGHKINFINNLLQFFGENNGERTGLYKLKMKELFQNIPLPLPIINPDGYKNYIKKLSRQ